MRYVLQNLLYVFAKGPFNNNYVTLRGGSGAGLRYTLRSVVTVALKSATKGGGVKNRPKKRYVIIERPITAAGLVVCFFSVSLPKDKKLTASFNTTCMLRYHQIIYTMFSLEPD